MSRIIYVLHLSIYNYFILLSTSPSANSYIPIFFYPVALWPNAGHGHLIPKVSRSHTTTHHSRQDSSGRVISSSQRPLPDNTQHSQQTNIHAPGRIRTHDLSRRAATDLRLRPCGHWDRPYIRIYSVIFLYCYHHLCSTVLYIVLKLLYQLYIRWILFLLWTKVS